MSEKLISANDLTEFVKRWGEQRGREEAADSFLYAINNAPAVDAVEVTREELGHLINDTIAYLWRMEETGRDKPECGYDSRKALLEKLQQFEKEHFPEMACCCGERREENEID